MREVALTGAPALPGLLRGAESWERGARGLLDAWLAERADVVERLGPPTPRALIAAFPALRALRVDGGEARADETQRKSLGTWYTPEPLVRRLVRAALDPAIDAAGDAEAVLALRVVDPAAGAGAFLVVAAEHLAQRLEQRFGPGPWAARAAGCLVGADLDPLAVAFARAALGPEAVLHVGDALVGAPAGHGDPDGFCAAFVRRKALHWHHLHPDGFDAVVGNPPWERIRPERRHFFRGDVDLSGRQGRSLERAVGALGADRAADFARHAEELAGLTRFLRESGVYRDQRPSVDGRRAGGDPDLSRAFLERAWQLLRPGGRLALVLPASTWQVDGAADLRRRLLTEGTIEELVTYENAGRWAFDIDTRWRFSTVVAEKAPSDGSFPASFRRLGIDGPPDLRLSRERIAALSPTWALLELRSEAEARLAERLHRGFPSLDGAVTYRCELHQTNDAQAFRTPVELAAAGFVRVAGERWLGPDGARWVPVYVGRMIHAFDPAYQGWVSGEGPRQRWEVLPFEEKRLRGLHHVASPLRPPGLRVGFRDIANKGNERTLLPALLPPGIPATNKVPVLLGGDPLALLAVLGSFVADWLVRLRVDATLNWTHLRRLPMPVVGAEVRLPAAALACVIPELAGAWALASAAPWSPARDAATRAALRAELDAIVADAYGLAPDELARVLDTFPLAPRAGRDRVLLAFLRRRGLDDATLAREVGE